MWKKRCIVLLCCGALLLGGCTQKAPADAKLVDTKEKMSDCGLLEPRAYAALSNEKLAWGMKKVEGSAPEVDKALVNLVEQYGGVYKTEEPKKIYLTFDEGYETGYTAQILDTLKKTGVRAAFFITGDYLKTQPELVERMVKEGHSVGNHTYSHPSMPEVTDDEKLAKDILRLSQAFTELTGAKMQLIRPPMGEFSERTLAISRDLGLKSVFWSFAYVDWQRDVKNGAQYAYDCIMPYMHDGAIVLLHAVSPDNAAALEQVIVDLQAKGYTFGVL